eukprot:TRINITY_DN1050_c0_g2_i1.p1 TRINITY_DN1050_c0_g2~~TRINITY_DN1050_c0_g2_i1.p1  ORF type:complete len:164 (-),score=4.00 TRINITY_DN1050_c0_g2_i1:40-531(-)
MPWLSEAKKEDKTVMRYDRIDPELKRQGAALKFTRNVPPRLFKPRWLLLGLTGAMGVYLYRYVQHSRASVAQMKEETRRRQLITAYMSAVVDLNKEDEIKYYDELTDEIMRHLGEDPATKLRRYETFKGRDFVIEGEFLSNFQLRGKLALDDAELLRRSAPAE